MAKQRKQDPAAGPPAAGSLPAFTPPEAPALPAAAQTPRCDNCRHWLPLEKSLGRCRRTPPYAPHGAITPYGTVFVHPLTPADEACGEHSPA